MPSKDVRGRRIGAALIDLVLYSAAGFALFFLMAESTQGPVVLDAVNFELTAGDETWYVEGGDAVLLWLLDLGLALFWFGLLPGATGWTPGKLMTGLRVVRADREPAGVGRNLVRPFLWIADGFPYFLPGLVGFILVLATKEHRRVADFVAGTYVVAKQEVGVTPAALRPASDDRAPAPSWYPDPGGQPLLRWWDGTRWTPETRPAPPPSSPER
jgi:uncharacterized RDD family membrane protein YckC